MNIWRSKSSGVQKRPSQMQRIILVRSAISTAQILAAYAKITPTVIHDPSTVNECVKEALRILHMSDDDLVRVCPHLWLMHLSVLVAETSYQGTLTACCS